MTQELLQQAWQISWPILQVLGITSLTGGFAFLVAYHALPPNITVKEVKDKSSKHNFESRLIIKNIGKLPAFNITVDFSNMNIVIGGLVLKNITARNCGSKAKQLASGEEMEIPVVPHTSVPPGVDLTSCDYLLELKYDLKLPFYSKQFLKTWHVELRNLSDGFAWQTSLR